MSTEIRSMCPVAFGRPRSQLSHGVGARPTRCPQVLEVEEEPIGVDEGTERVPGAHDADARPLGAGAGDERRDLRRVPGRAI